MKSVAVVILAVAGIVGAYLLGTRARPSVAPIVFINFTGLPRSHFDELRQACPNVAFSLSKEGSEYRLSMSWINEHWQSSLIREDSVLLMTSNSPDFKQIMREACRAIKPDTAWLLETRKRKVSEPHAVEESNRYELREIHDGSISRSALLDKRTGKVWGWHALSVKGWFDQEDISPEPDK
jgi:hypothetical protein